MRINCNIGSVEGAVIFAKAAEKLSYEEETNFLSKFPQYVFYDTWGTKNHRECYCTACGQWFSYYKSEQPDLFRGHHNDYGYCPECGADIQLKSLGRIKTGSGLKTSLAAAFIRPADDGGIYVYAGIGFREFDLPGTMRPLLDFVPKAIYYFAPKRLKCWKRSVGSYWYRCMFGYSDWREMKSVSEPFPRNPLYGYDNDYWLFGVNHIYSSAFQYCQIEEWYHNATGNWICEENNTVKLCINYLANYAMKPQMEMAVKMGLPELCTDLCEGVSNCIDINWRSNKPWDFLKLSKADCKAFLIAPSVGLLKALHIARGEGCTSPVENLSVALHSFGRMGFEELIECAAICRVSLEKALDYVAEQGYNALGLWSDYLEMARKLGYDFGRLDVLMPKNLKERHDAAAETIEVAVEEKKRIAYQKRLKALEDKYSFRYNGYRIMVPVSAEEIVREGKTLRHCVGGYAGRHIKGDTVILFLRRDRKPGTSFVTIEMKGANFDQIRQIHGYRNDSYNAVKPSEKHAKFLEIWLEWLRSGSRRDHSGKPIIKEVNAA